MGFDSPTSTKITRYIIINYKGMGVLFPRPLAFLTVYHAITPNITEQKTSRFGHSLLAFNVDSTHVCAGLGKHPSNLSNDEPAEDAF